MKLLSLSSNLCLVIFIASIFRSFQLYFKSTRDLSTSNKDDPWFFKQDKVTLPSNQTHAAYRNDVRIENKPNNIFYFIQLSDLHISKFQSKGHSIHFLHFLQSILPLFKPEFVVVTGDLIDAKDKTRTVSEQYIEEWQTYQSAVKEAVVDIPWYDMRGNHDCFDLTGWEAYNNYYKQFGKSADQLNLGKGVYQWQLEKPFGNYSFVAVDACPKIGPSRPFNFFGYLTTNTMNRLVSAILPNTFNHTFMFAHYPTTTLIPGVSSEGYTFRDLANHFSIYFCGHLHRLTGGLGDVLKSYNRRTDSLELEVSDMKDHGTFRIVAVDHDLVSFVDVDLPLDQIQPANPIVPLTKDNAIIWPTKKIHPSPIILITNPKDFRFTLPSKEPLQFIHKSTHIRFLVFSEYEPNQLDIKVFMDDKQHNFPIEYVGNSDLPLYTTVWEPNDFDDKETHHVRVQVTTPNGNVTFQEIPFRMDNMRVKIQGGFGELIIGMSITHLVRFLCLFAIFAMLVCLLIPKIFNDLERQQDEYQDKENYRNKLLLEIHRIDLGQSKTIYAPVHRLRYVWTHRFFEFPETQSILWYACFIFLIGFLTLPWFRAEFIPSANVMGNFYLWGIQFKGDQWISVDTWLYVIFQLTYNVGLFILIFVWKSTRIEFLQCKGLQQPSTQKKLVCDRLWFQLITLLVWLWRVNDHCHLAKYYGGVYPTIVFNLMSLWLLFVIGMIFNGIYKTIQQNNQSSELFMLDICDGCQQSTTDQVPLDYLNHRHLSDEEDTIQDSSDSSPLMDNRRALKRNAAKQD